MEEALATVVPLAALATSTWSMVVQVLRRFYKLVASCVVDLVRTIVEDGTAGLRNAPSVLSVVRWYSWLPVRDTVCYEDGDVSKCRR